LILFRKKIKRKEKKRIIEMQAYVTREEEEENKAEMMTWIGTRILAQVSLLLNGQGRQLCV
jgi:hypothetical protein